MTDQANGQPRTRGLASLRLTEPVRLYLYGVGSLILAGLVLGGVLTQDWQDWGLAMLAEVLAVVPATEAARATVYSPATAMRQLVAAVNTRGHAQ